LTGFLAMVLLLRHTAEPRPVRTWMGIGLSVGAAVLCRSVGLSLLLAFGMVLVQEAWVNHARRTSIVVRAVIFLITVAALYKGAEWAVKPEKGAGYRTQFMSKNIDFLEEGSATVSDIALRIPKNGSAFIKGLVPMSVGRCWHEYLEYLRPGWTAAIQACLYFFGILTGALFVVGFLVRIRNKPSVVEYYVFFYLASMSVIWFYYEVYRYLMPVAPFLFLYIADGLRWVSQKIWVRRKGIQRLHVIFLGFLLFVNVVHSAVEIYKYKFSDHRAKLLFAPYSKTVQWLKTNVPPDKIIVADEPRWYALETNLKVATFLKSRNPEHVMKYLDAFPEAVIVFDTKRRFQRICLTPVFERDADRFDLLQVFDHVKLYRLKAGPRV